MFAPWVSICSFHRHVVGLFRARSRQRLVLKRLNSAVAEAGSLDWRHAFAKGGCRDVRPAAQYLSLASPRERHQREGDPLSVTPSGQPAVLASGGVRANSLHCVSLKQRAALIRLKLCSSARTEGKGSRAAFRAIAALGPGVGMSVAQAVGQGSGKRSHWGRSEVAGS